MPTPKFKHNKTDNTVELNVPLIIDSYLSALNMPGKNLIINGNGIVAQFGTTFTAATTPTAFKNDDDNFLLDRMVLLSDGNDIVDISQEKTTVPTGAYSCIKFLVATGNKKFAYFQPIEARNCARVIGGTASLSFKARIDAASTLSNLRAAVIAWDGTEDSVVSDVISAWNGAGSNPTLIANWFFENTPISLAALTTSFQTFKIEGISIDQSGAKNVGVLIWSDDVTTTAGDELYLGDIQLEPGDKSTPFDNRPYGMELDLCRLYGERIGEKAGVGYGIAQGIGGTTVYMPLSFYPKRVDPTITVGVNTSGEDFILWDSGAAAKDVTSRATTSVGKDNALLSWISGTSMGAGDTVLVRDDAVGISFIDIRAEM